MNLIEYLFGMMVEPPIPVWKVTWGPSKSIILAASRVQEQEQFKATPATMTSTDFRAEGSLGGTVHRP